MESEGAADIVPTQDLYGGPRESVTKIVLVPDPILDIDPVLDPVPDRVVDRASVPVSESNCQMPKLANLNDLSRCRSSRTLKPSQRARDSDDKTVKSLFDLCCYFPTVCYSTFIVNVHVANKSMTLLEKAVSHVEKIYTLFYGSINTLHHTYVSTVDNGTYTLRKMLKQEDKAEFIKAMEVEVGDHESRNHGSLMSLSEMPCGAETILLIWSFIRKLYPDG